MAAAEAIPDGSDCTDASDGIEIVATCGPHATAAWQGGHPPGKADAAPAATRCWPRHDREEGGGGELGEGKGKRELDATPRGGGVDGTESGQRECRRVCALQMELGGSAGCRPHG